jgi:hypothetical protein
MMVAVPVAMVGYFFQVGTQQPEDLPPPKVYTPAQVKQAREHIETVKEESKKAYQAAQKGKRLPFKYVLTEDDLNAYLTQEPALGERLREKGFKDMRVSLGEGTLGIQGNIPAMGRHVWVRAEGPVTAGQRGRIVFQPTDLEFGRMKMAVPGSVREQILEQVRKETKDTGIRVPGEIRELRISGGKMVIRGITDPEIAKEMQRDAAYKNRTGGQATSP